MVHTDLWLKYVLVSHEGAIGHYRDDAVVKLRTRSWFVKQMGQNVETQADMWQPEVKCHASVAAVTLWAR